MPEEEKIAKSLRYLTSEIPGEFKSTTLSENIDKLELTKSKNFKKKFLTVNQ
ncbi:hypothetical protein [Bacillus velezensis]|uniref:hypothetical protein n=1 Tax=Bacillus velezensis TaxID=492670 RepID=UPI001386EF6E|nr:hypothetical protein [Bacillus velezensis]